MFKFTKPDSNSEAACFGCGRKTFVESKYFDKKWEAGVSHSEDRVQRNAVYCGDCQEHRFYGQSLAERILVFLDATIGRVDRKIQRKVGGFFA